MNPEVVAAVSLKKKADGYVGEIVYSTSVVIACTLFVTLNKNVECKIPIRTWLGVFTGNYLLEVIIAMY
jgi:hypothetical protein